MDLSNSSPLPPGWTVRSINDVCQRVTSGGTPSRRAPYFYLGGTWPWVKTQELQDGWLRDTEEHITDEAVQRSSAKVLPLNTILLAMYGATVGKLALLGREMTCNQACCALVVDGAVADYRFLYYVLLNARSRLTHLAVGAAQQNLSGTTIKSLRFAFPPRSEQRIIAGILGALDDKIELNRKMSATLEAMARALFKSWFIDFDPVRAKAEGRDPGLPPEIAALFPDSFEASELGPIPEDWRVRKIADIASVSRETVTPLDFPDEVFEHYSIPAYDTGCEAVIEYGASIKSNKFVVLRDSILLSRLNPRIPRIWAPWSMGPRRAVCSTEFAVMNPRMYSKEWLYCLVSGHTFCAHLTTMVTGTSGSHQRVKPESLLEMSIVAPPRDVGEMFTSTVHSLLARKQLARSESSTLAALRDALLPKLISGEIRVNDTERMLAASA